MAEYNAETDADAETTRARLLRLHGDEARRYLEEHSETLEDATAESEARFVLATPKGFTESFDAKQIETLVLLGLIEHERDGYVLCDGAGNGLGPLHRFYREARVTSLGATPSASTESSLR